MSQDLHRGHLYLNPKKFILRYIDKNFDRHLKGSNIFIIDYALPQNNIKILNGKEFRKILYIFGGGTNILNYHTVEKIIIQILIRGEGMIG